MALQGLLLTSKGADTLGPCSLGRRESDGEPRGKHCTLFPLPVGHADHSLSGPTLPPRRHKSLEGCFPIWPCSPPPHRPLLDCEVHSCVAPPGEATREWTMQGAVVVMTQSGRPARGYRWGVAAGVEAAIRRPINRLPSPGAARYAGKKVQRQVASVWPAPVSGRAGERPTGHASRPDALVPNRDTCFPADQPAVKVMVPEVTQRLGWPTVGWLLRGQLHTNDVCSC